MNLRGLGLRKIPFAEWLWLKVRPKVVVIDGFRMYLDPRDLVVSEKLYQGSYEPEEIATALAALPAGGIAVDAGANLGFFSLHFSRKASKVYAFEPAPKTFGLLQKNIATNECANVEIHECALSDIPGTAFLWINEKNHGDSRVVANGSLAIPMKRLDDLIPQGTPVDFIKIDTQGSETKILRGAKRIMQESPNVKMLIEYWPYGLHQNGSSGEELLSVLHQYGFSFRALGKALEHCTLENQRFTNLLVERPS